MGYGATGPYPIQPGEILAVSEVPVFEEFEHEIVIHPVGDVGNRWDSALVEEPLGEPLHLISVRLDVCLEVARTEELELGKPGLYFLGGLFEVGVRHERRRLRWVALDELDASENGRD